MNDLSIHEVTAALDRAGLAYKVRGRYIVSQCPKHTERNPSCQIFLDDFFCNCFAGCGRFPITDPFPELRNNSDGAYHPPLERRPQIAAVQSTHYKNFELIEDWARLPLIPRTHTFKGLPLEVLDDLGWRWDAEKASYFIPYFSVGRDSIPFAQWRHLSGSRRFTFLAGAKPTLYGKWNISPGERLFIVEGTSDAAVLEYCGVPSVAVPSAASGVILANFAKAAHQMGCTLVYAGDNDQAGEALHKALDDTGVPYRVCQPPEGFKDWGELFEAKGRYGVAARTWPKLFE